MDESLIPFKLTTRTVGLLFLVAGVLGCVYFWFLFQTTHPFPIQPGSTTSMGFTISSIGIVDEGLVQVRHNGILTSIGSAIVGAILFGLAPREPVKA